MPAQVLDAAHQVGQEQAGHVAAEPVPNQHALDDLAPGMVLEGVVTNVAAFGAFVILTVLGLLLYASVIVAARRLMPWYRPN